MAWFRCIKDNQYDGVRAYRAGENYEFSANPSTSLFTAITDANADRTITRQKLLPTHTDLQGDHHIHEVLQFEEDVTFSKDIFFDNITGDAGIQKHVAWYGGTGLVQIDSPGLTKTGDTEFTISAGSANFLDLSDPSNPTISHVTWGAITGVTDTYAATNLRTWVGIDSTGTPALFADAYDAVDTRTNVIIGVLTHTDGATITQLNVIPIVGIDLVGMASDTCAAIRFVNLEGNIYSGASSSVNSLAVTAGKTFACGRNYLIDPDSPNVTTEGAASPITTFFTAYSDGAGGQTIGSASVVDSTKWDDGSGTLATLDDGHWITHRLYRSTTTGSTLLVYGQEQHKGRSEALGSIEQELFIPLPGSSQLILRGYLSLKKGAAGLQDSSSAVFTPADKFGIGPANRLSNGFDTGVPSYKDYSFTSRGLGAGTYFIGGYYRAPATDANLTQASATISYGTANSANGSHPFIVAGGPGTVDAGVVGLRATFTKVEDDGTRTPSTTEVISSDITTLSLNEYIEVSKCVGTVQYELYVVSGSPTVYSLDFNYGLAKYEDFGNRDFMITDFEVIGRAGATDTSAEISLLYHTPIGWTYSAAGFVPGNGNIVSMATDYSTDDNVVNNEQFAYKRSSINFPVSGAGRNGIIIEIVATQNNTYQILNAHVGVEF